MNEVRSVYGEVGRDTRVRVGTIGVPGWRLLGRVRRRARWLLVLTEGCIRARWQSGDRTLVAGIVGDIVAGLLAGARSGCRDRLRDASTRTRLGSGVRSGTESLS